MKNNHKHGEAGYTLIGVLIVFALIAVLGVSTVTLSVATVKTSTNERDHQSAYYIAEAGLTYQVEKMKKEILEFYDSNDVVTRDNFTGKLGTLVKDQFEYNEFEKVNSIQPVAKIDVELVTGTDDQFIIRSTGEIGKEKRTVTSSLQVGWEEKFIEVEVGGESEPYELPPLTVFTKEHITLSNGPIKGNIATQSMDKYAIKAGSGVRKVQEGNIYVPVIGSSNANRTCKNTPTENYKSHSVVRPQWEATAPCPTEVEEMWEIPQLPKIPDLPEVEMNNPHNISLSGDDKREIELKKDKEYNDITLDSATTLTFNLGESDRIIVVENLKINNGFIKIKGSGRLTIYIKGEFIFKGGSLNEKSKFKQLDIFLKGHEESNKNKTVELLDYVQVFGSLHAEDANIKFTGSAGFYGNLFTGGKKLELFGHVPNTSQLILAPNADVTLTGSSNIKGRIISKSFDHQSAAEIIFGVPFDIEGPISPAALGGGSGGNGSGSNTEIIATGATLPPLKPTPPRETE